MMSSKSLLKLDVWRKAKDFALLIHKEVLPLLPKEEKWAMSQQVRRAAQSIPANIAEGHGRFYYQENIRFCYIARGSLEETISFLILAHELGYIHTELYAKLDTYSEDLTRLISGYIAYLKRSKAGKDEPGSQVSIREALIEYDINDIDYEGS